ncbi:MAG TPA: hypothetical protein VHM90_22530 [Phycisphaerae bacterium]|nr:hypothetical protein [Phycisphaerae bacterium]
MPFRLWHYIGKLALPALALPCVAFFFWPNNRAVVLIGASSFIALLALGLVGGVMGVLMAAGKLRMRCPFCGRSGPAWGSKREGMRMECPDCGVIRAAGRFNLQLAREVAADGVADDNGALEDMPPRERPEELPLFPAGWKYFRRWRTCRWYLLMLLAPCAGLCAAWMRGSFGGGIVVLVMGGTFGAVVFVQINSGMSSSNWGTYFRGKEPWRYWADVSLWTALYLGISAAGWIIK